MGSDFPCSMQAFPHVKTHPTPLDLTWSSPSTLSVPFPTSRLASTALKAIQVDAERSPLVRRQLSLAPGTDGDDTHFLKVDYRATTNRMLRVSVNSFMDSLRLVVEVMEQLDEDVLAQEDSISNKIGD